MNLWSWLLCGATGFAVSWGVILWVLRSVRQTGELRRGQDLHHGAAAPVPRLGGIALAAGFAAAALAVMLAFPDALVLRETNLIILVSSLAMFGVGLWDDLQPLGARRKLLFQITIALGVYAAGLRIEEFQIPLFGYRLSLGTWGGIVVTVGWLVAITNLINLIDGVDGLAGGIALMLMCLLSWVCLNAAGSHFLAVGMAGALLGFLRFNFPPARIYMGDGGAYMLGFLVGVTTIASSQKGTVLASLAAPLFVLALPIIDTSLAILRRGLRGLPIFRPDRRHIHHRLMQQGWSHRRTVLTIYSFCLLFLGLGFAAFWSRGQWLPALSGLAVLIVLLAAGRLSFSREWFFVGRVVGNSLRMRNEVQFALAQTRWLELEARRSRSVEELWNDFVFIAGKMGFMAARLRLGDGERQWDQSSGCAHLRLFTMTLEGGNLGVLELRARVGQTDASQTDDPPITCGNCAQACNCHSILDEKAFEILSEVLIEGWLKAARVWRRYHNEDHPTPQAVLRFDMCRQPSWYGR
jgi:UDP-GlcNAc:undecaprenyl-phosphate GlcNAc-1-phosphate transferase